MAKPSPQFEVACPCCGATLKIDPEVKAVIAHTAKAVPKTFETWSGRARHEGPGQPQRVHLPAVGGGAETSGRSAGEEIQEALKRAKETPDTGKPLRDFDLD